MTHGSGTGRVVAGNLTVSSRLTFGVDE
jgi:hypothetical protein